MPIIPPISKLLTNFDLQEKNWMSDMELAIEKMEESTSPVVLLVKQGVLS